MACVSFIVSVYTANLRSRVRACTCVRAFTRREKGRWTYYSRGQVIFNIVDAQSARTKKGGKSRRPFVIIRFVPRSASKNSTIFLTGRVSTFISLITLKGKCSLIVLFLFLWKNSFALKEYDDAINLI